MKNLYKILGIRKNATKQTIKKAYRELSKKLHPDKGGNIEEFNELNKAYQILMDDEKRKKYDDGDNIENILKKSEEFLIIGTMFNLVIEQSDPMKTDIIKATKILLNNKIAENNNLKNKNKKDILKYNTFLGKIKHKNKKNFLGEILEGKIMKSEKNIEFLEEKKKSLEKALEIIGEYDYSFFSNLIGSNNIFSHRVFSAETV
jgi:curved DNA-binding protein CbpA